MITQRVVSYGEITLTRLPAGRAAGFVWLSFVAAGNGVDAWPIHEHVGLAWLDGTPGEVVDSSRGGDGPHHIVIEVLDAGYDRLIISYIESDRVIDHEVIELPSRA